MRWAPSPPAPQAHGPRLAGMPCDQNSREENKQACSVPCLGPVSHGALRILPRYGEDIRRTGRRYGAVLEPYSGRTFSLQTTAQQELPSQRGPMGTGACASTGGRAGLANLLTTATARGRRVVRLVVLSGG